MNTYNPSYQALTPNLLKSVYEILNAPLLVGQQYWAERPGFSYIKIQDRFEVNKKSVDCTFVNPICQYGISPDYLSSQFKSLNDYWYWDLVNSDEISTEELSNTKDKINLQNLDTYKELRKVAQESNPEITKEEIYEQLLKPFKYEKNKYYDNEKQRYVISYICKYHEWNKGFTKTWNLLDHMRMHEGIKPFECRLCGKSFTQKGNLKKHNIVQHSSQSVTERKKFKCSICDRSYTERYNLMVNFKFNIDCLFYENCKIY